MGSDYKKTMLVISVVAAAASLTGMFFTASIALGFNKRLARKLGFPVSE